MSSKPTTSIYLTLLILIISTDCLCQWKKIMDFGSPVACIYFFDVPQKPTEGFIGTIAPDVWQTKDQGKTWKRIAYPPNVDGLALPAKSFSFKDKKVGWFNDIGGTFRASTYYTVDGGDSWTPLSFHGANSVFYVPSTGYVVGGSNAGSYCYSTDGINFQTIGTIFSDATLNVAFSDNLHGIISPFSIYNNIYTTSDGGISWLKGELEGDLYQPVGIKNSLIFFAIREASSNAVNNGDFLRSTDGGVNWQKIYTYWNTAQYAVTGTVQYGHGMSLFFQTTADNSEGIMMSDDSGKTFMSLCGPKNEVDTKFFVRDSFIYAGDKYGGLWLNTTGIGSNSSPILSKQLVALIPQSCSDIYDTVTFTLFDSCNGRQATLLQASNDTNSSFSFNAGTLPRTIQINDTLIVRYRTDNSLNGDSDAVHLRFKLGWKIFDTVIGVSAKSVDPSRFVFSAFQPDTVRPIALTCDNSTNSLSFLVRDTCRGIYGSALSGNVSGSPAFTTPTFFPITPTGVDSVVIRFSPRRFGLDTASLLLHFDVEGIPLDTSITLIGNYAPTKTSLTPVLSDTSLTVTSSNCIGASGHVYYSVFDSCLGTKGELLSATVLGSTNFQVNVNPDSILVTYNGAGYDTASLALKFRIYEYEYDTVITLYGIPSPSRDSLSFSARFAEEEVTAGGVTNLVIEPSKQVAGKGLTELALSVTYNGDILERVAEATAIPNANITVTAESVTGGITTTTLRITGTDLSLDPTQPAATIRFRTYLSDTTITPITLTTKLNPQDPSYERCTLSATTSNATFALTLLCGDTSISGFLKYGKLQLSTIRPNPTSKVITVDFHSPTKGETRLQVIDELGRVILEEKLEAKAGTNTRTIPLPSTWSGTYYLRLQMGNDVVTGKFVKQ